MIRSQGHATLCGVLFIAYLSGTTVAGDYMLCALFQPYLVIAMPSKTADMLRIFEVVAIISLADLRPECADNEKGPIILKILYRSC